MRYFLMLLAGLSASPGFAATAFEQARDTFTGNSGKIEQAFDQALQDASAEYLDTLNRGKEAMQTGGDLEAVLKIRTEIKRFQKEGAVGTDKEDDLLKGIGSARKRYATKVEKARQTREQHTAQLLTYYVKHLQELQRQLVQKDLVEEALEVRKEAARKGEELEVFRKAEAERRKQWAEKRAALQPSFGERPLPVSLFQGAIGHYAFDRNESRSITDKTRHRNHGKARDVTWVAKGKKGAGLQIEFGKGHVELPRKMLSGLEAFSFTIWVKVPEYRGNDFPAFVSSYAGSVSRNVGIGIYRGTGKHWCEVTTADGNFSFLGKEELPWNEWYHAALVYDGKTLREFVNGKPGASTKATGKVVPLSGLYIGSHGPRYSPKSLSALVDEVMLFDRALSEKELGDLYRHQR